MPSAAEGTGEPAPRQSLDLASAASDTVLNKHAQRQWRDAPVRGKRTITLAEVARHCTKDDAWIAVNGRVYDITAFIANHPGWDCACGISTIIAILGALGRDCSADFNAIHTAHAHRQLAAYCIGHLAPGAAPLA